MTEKDWEKLADLLNKVANGDGSYQEKAKQLENKMEEYGASLSMEEIVAWFPTEVLPSEDSDASNED